MAQPIGPKEMALRSLGQGEVARRYVQAVVKAPPKPQVVSSETRPTSREKSPTSREKPPASRENASPSREGSHATPAAVEAAVQAAVAKVRREYGQAQAEIYRLEAEVARLKQDLSARAMGKCEVCEARRRANAARQRKRYQERVKGKGKF